MVRKGLLVVPSLTLKQATEIRLILHFDSLSRIHFFSLVLTGTKTAGPSLVEPGSPSNRTPGISFQLEAGQLQDMGVKGLTWVRYTEAFEHWSFFFKNSLKMMQIYRMLSCTNLVQSCPGSASGTPHHPDWPPSTAEWKDSESKSMSEKFEGDNKVFSFNRSVHPLCCWFPHLSLVGHQNLTWKS